MDNIIELSDRLVCIKCKLFLNIPNSKIYKGLIERVEEGKLKFIDKHKNCK